MNKFIKSNFSNIGFVGFKRKIEKEKIAYSIVGTALLLENNKLATCAHVYNSIPNQFTDSLFVSFPDDPDKNITNYSFFSIKDYKKDDSKDIAIFSVNDSNFISDRGLKTKDLMKVEEIDNLNLTDDIYFVGFPLASQFMALGMGITMMATKCIIGAKKYKNKDKKIDFLLVDKAINPGSSGSPVFLGNKIIGLASGNMNKIHKIGEDSINSSVGVGIVRTSNYILELLGK